MPPRRGFVNRPSLARTQARTRVKGKDWSGQISDIMSIHLPPPDMEERQYPGHWKGDQVKDAGNASAVGTPWSSAPARCSSWHTPSRPVPQACCRALPTNC